MATGTVAVFERSLERLDVGWTRTSAETVESTLSGLVRPPAVGVGLGDDLALPASVRLDPTPADLREATTGVTKASLAIADYGSLVLESSPESAEQVSLFPDLHVAVLHESDIVDDMAAAFEWLGPRLRADGDDGKSAILATGPSATADMGELVRGAHGPKEVHVVVVTDGDEDEANVEGGGSDE
ncbi:L-lactate dehydrogenase complex protein LldG [Halogranum amylolyticum]|uniref:L-lactate dehydrogenase complex protein LldG n=1 Tax=Halogranum amylolyticum TaxID=660520 RepID=A0A1H8TBS1_9EURY|nr:LUD domain-containing protein [Halogranum amylolyticum]SEO87933.1 L-lactate dehydrogenase complex protein LldG [Halogranum amylolyticum]